MRRIAGGLVVASVLGLAYGCGSSGDDTVGVNGDDAGTSAALDATAPTDDSSTNADAGPDASKYTDGNYPIKHVIVIVKENHTFDNYFGTFPGAEGTTTCKNATGTFDCGHAPNKTPRDLCHEHSCALADWNGGQMNGWDTGDSKNSGHDKLNYAQYTESDIPSYWAYARKYTLGDHFFSNMLGPSFPGHAFLLAAQAGWSTGNPDTQVTHPYWGCDQTSDTRVTILDNGTCTEKRVFPCFKIPSVPDLLPIGTDWRFYGSNFYVLNEVWSMFNAVDSIRNGPGWAHIVKVDQFESDIDTKSLPAITWLVNQDLNSEHPNVGGVCQGENWTVERVNKIMQSDYWKDTAIIFTMDDFGGWYDHVPPPRQYGCDAEHPYGLGFRLPLIIMSPYAKPGYIFKEQAEQASIPRFIERIVGATKTLTDLDPAAQDKGANDLMDAFDFDQKPNDPLILPTRSCP